MNAAVRAVKEPSTPGLTGYLLFVASWLLHIPARIPALGALRVDLILVGLLFILLVTDKSRAKQPATRTDFLLKLLFGYVLITLPFVEWPGTVMHTGLPNLIKAVVFYYFTIAFVRSERDLKKFMFVF